MSSSNNNNNNNTSNSFELQDKADEWIDVTPTEELLRAQLTRFQEAFEKCTTQLDSSRLENDLLRDRGTALEHETNDLRSLLERTHVDLETTQMELATTRGSSKEEISGLEATLRDTTEKSARAEEETRSLENQWSETNRERSVESSQQKLLIQRLERELKSSKAETKMHKDAAIGFAEDLRSARDDHKSTRSELRETREVLSSEKERHSKARETLGTIATLAESIKAEKQGLERSLAREHRARTEAESSARAASSSEANALRKQLAELDARNDQRTRALQSELSERLTDLKGSNNSIEFLQIELKGAEKSLRESSLEKTSLKALLAAMESGRHELLERQSELEGSLEEVHDDLTVTHEGLQSTSDLLEKAILERDTLRTQRSTYLRSSEREAQLESKLSEQKKAFEDRLRDIHSILGLKFTTAFQSEVKKRRKTAIEQMPKSFRVPLLHQHQHQQQQRVKLV